MCTFCALVIFSSLATIGTATVSPALNRSGVSFVFVPGRGSIISADALCRLCVGSMGSVHEGR